MNIYLTRRKSLDQLLSSAVVLNNMSVEILQNEIPNIITHYLLAADLNLGLSLGLLDNNH